MMNGNSMMWGMALGGLLFTVIAVLCLAALIKYLFLKK